MPLKFLRARCAPVITPLSWPSRLQLSPMPLVAKIINPAFLRQATSDAASYTHPRPEPGDDPDDVLFTSHYGVRTIQLNRPGKLNSLNASMVRKIIPRLKEWENSQLANVIIIAGAGEKAFCAGGDVAAVVKEITSNPDNLTGATNYFALEYRLDHLIATYPKPYVAYMDGITMGGGVGLSVHAPFRIATDRTRVAMPETSIGFFPDVGGSFFLPRLEGSIGTYLALTSKQLSGVDAYYTGLATHYIHHTTLPSLTARLGELEFGDYDTLTTRLSLINETIGEFSSSLPYDQPMGIAGNKREAIDRCFSHSTMEAIIQALKAEEGEELKSWAETTLEELSQRSPTSLKVTLRQMRIGKRWNISETFQREFHLATRMIAHPDFVAGVSARLLSKPPIKPEWNPPTFETITSSDVAQFFTVEGQDRLPLIGEDERWTEYPTNFGLPREDEIKAAVEEWNERSAERDPERDEQPAPEQPDDEQLVTEWDDRQQVMMEKREFSKEAEIRGLQALLKRRYAGKVGVVEKVKEVVERKCGFNKERGLVWQEG